MNDLFLSSQIKDGYLLKAWKELYAKASPRKKYNTRGVDEQTLEDFKLKEKNNLKEISLSMRSNNGYQFSDLFPIFIKKANGKPRIISIPTVKDRIVQKSIKMVLQKSGKWSYCKFNGINFGFVKEKGVKDAINKAIKERRVNPYVYKTDITSFFDRIDRNELKEIVKKKIKSKSLHKIIYSIIDCEIEAFDSKKLEIIKKNGIEKGRGIRQGMPLSPLFANLYLNNFDLQLIKKRIRCVRYADDLLFFAKSKKECLSIHKFCVEELGKIGLEIPDLYTNGKTEILTPTEPVDFLGICIMSDSNGDYWGGLSEKQLIYIKSKINDYSNIVFLRQNEITLKNFGHKINSLVNGYKGVYENVCSNYDEIETIIDISVFKSNL